jgi:DNA-binding NtrC family response regulator
MLAHPVAVTSRYGHGSCFSISVPARDSQPESKTPGKAWIPAGDLHGLRVLCLENTPEVLDAMQDLLKRWGCDVLACRDIREAREKLIDGAPETVTEAIIADYSLDGQENGLDLLREYSAQLPDKEFLGIMISAEQDPTLRGQVRAAGFYFLAKPVDPASLRALLRRATALREKRDDSPPVQIMQTAG